MTLPLPVTVALVGYFRVSLVAVGANLGRHLRLQSRNEPAIQGFLEKIDIAIRTGLAKAPKVTFYL
jgi:hypothetical protein